MADGHNTSNSKSLNSPNSRTARSKKSRTPISCDRCKGRKTKCVDPVPGPCNYCARIGVSCGIPSRRKQRPFYHVTEEEYRSGMQILQHLLPSKDLSPETLRDIAKKLQDGENIETISMSNLQEGADVLNIDNVRAVADPEVEEVEDLHGQLGCLMEDSLGEYRYVGAYAEIAFNAAVCSMKGAPSPESLIEPSKFSFPPRSPTSPNVLQDIPIHDQPYLPPRDYCNYYVSRFFEEVHCIYWLYPVEQFHARLDETYSSCGTVSSRSWLCALYSICALGAVEGDTMDGPACFEPESNGGKGNTDRKTSHDYLALAKALLPEVNDEADIDSVRALALLSIALQTFGFRITSYLHMGTSIRIAFSLGLQHDKPHVSQSVMTRQRNRRIWWTLYLLDQSIASRCGSPCAIDERSLRIQAAFPSEQVLNPGTNTPLGILAVSASLCRLRKDIIQTIYPEQSPDSRTVSYSKVTNFIAALQKWLAAVPSHLKWGVPVAPSHKRAIAVLHLKYWDATMLLTQPFLLYLVLRSKQLSDLKRCWFEKLGDTCVEAAQDALSTLKTMELDQTLSSLVTFDATCVLKVVMVLVLALVKTNSEEYRNDIVKCVSLLQGMEQIGFCQKATQELPIRLKELGVLKDKDDSSNQNLAFSDQTALDFDL
ncbi:putative transcriptional regulatory protein [Lachnellula suecica]|uniref:Putative transcriptional regulatory protein n=1 Tax=Lachnellula suecica TaxID=602035 RepID=A0A8T9C9Y8_9HELO|nr:putative transcriptional regulatory protein [Lachnellula suecica]